MEAVGHIQLDRCLDGIRAAWPASVDPGPLDQALADLSGHLQLILQEHAGMTDELLRAYEQLGIVFEATRKLPTVSSEDEVVRLFVNSLRATYHDAGLHVVRPDEAGKLCWDDPVPSAAELLAAPAGECLKTGQVQVLVVNPPQQGVAEVLVAPVQAGAQHVCAIVLTHDGRRPFVASDMTLVETLLVFCGDLIRNYQLTQELRRLSMDMVRALVGAIDQKDQYTSGHSNRVGYYSCLLGADIGLDGAELQNLEWAALLHDVGKIGIRDDVLKKAGKLTPEEFEHIKEHPVRSHEVVKNVPQLRDALPGVRHHHERYDGTGYPDKLKGDDIPLQARIIQVADVFDALTTSRSYRGAFSWEKALGILREEAGRVSDPRLAQLFEQVIRREMHRRALAGDPVDKPANEPSRSAYQGEIIP